MPTKSGITFEQPPTEERGKYDWAAIAADLRTRPGEWALIFDRDKTTFVNAFYLGLKDLPIGEFEARTSNSDRGVPKAQAEATGEQFVPRTCSLWLRYVGKNKEYA